MHKLLPVTFVTLALLGQTLSAFIPEDGNCNMRCNVSLVPLNTKMFASYKPWKVHYMTNASSPGDVDSVTRDGVCNPDGVCLVVDIIKMKDNSVGEYIFQLSTMDNVIIENSTIDGISYIRYVYPIAVSFEHGLLFHRCDPDGQADVDTRLIWAPEGEAISDDELKYFMEVDKMCNFRGELVKLSVTL